MKVVLLLVGPLVLIVVVVLAMFGTSGPADDDIRAQATIRVMGMLYGAYLVALSFVWTRRNARKERR